MAEPDSAGPQAAAPPRPRIRLQLRRNMEQPADQVRALEQAFNSLFQTFADLELVEPYKLHDFANGLKEHGWEVVPDGAQD